MHATVPHAGRQRRVRRTIGLFALLGGLAIAAALPALALDDDRTGEAAGSAAGTVAPAPTPPVELPAPSAEQRFATWFAGLAPDEQARFQLLTMTPEQQAAFAAMVAPTPPPPAPKPAAKPSPKPRGSGPANGYLACVRQRESRGNYGAVNRSSGAGGAYQFLQSTWNNTARHAGRPDLVGVHPSQASPADQDAMAAALYAWQGRAPWAGPGC